MEKAPGEDGSPRDVQVTIPKIETRYGFLDGELYTAIRRSDGAYLAYNDTYGGKEVGGPEEAEAIFYELSEQKSGKTYSKIPSPFDRSFWQTELIDVMKQFITHWPSVSSCCMWPFLMKSASCFG